MLPDEPTRPMDVPSGALAMVAARLSGGRRITVGGDKGYDTHDFVESCRALNAARCAESGTARWFGARRSHRTPSGLRGQPMDP
jgi:hypothetical protein